MKLLLLLLVLVIPCHAMNSLIDAYRATPEGKADSRGDLELIIKFGRDAEAKGLTKVFDEYPDFAKHYYALKEGERKAAIETENQGKMRLLVIFVIVGAAGLSLITTWLITRRPPPVFVAGGVCALALAFAYPPAERVVEPRAYELHLGKRSNQIISEGFVFIGTIKGDSRIVVPQWSVHLALAAFATALSAWWASRRKQS